MREHAGESQISLSSKMHVDRSLISRWESGKTKTPGSDALKKAATVLRIPVEAFQVGPDEAERICAIAGNDALADLFPEIDNRKYDKSLRGEYVAYSLLMHEPGLVSVTRITISEHPKGHLAFISQHCSGDAEWTGSGVVVVTPPCVFLVGSYRDKRKEPFMLVLLVGAQRDYSSEVLHGVVIAMSMVGLPSATRVSLVLLEAEDRHRAAPNQQLKPGNMKIAEIPEIARRALMKGPKSRVLQAFLP